MTQLFISHSSKNNAEALALSRWLTAEGWDDQFLDIDPQRGIVGGERWGRALHQAAGRCDAVLFLVSPDWLRSDWCRREFTIAQQLGKRLFVLLLDGAKRVDVEASMKEIWQLVDLSSGDDHLTRELTLPDETKSRHVYFSRSALMRLREGLKKAGLDPQSFPWPPNEEPNRAPYRGLAPLEAQDAGIFFGREAPITELLAQLRGLREAAPPRFLAILGASGAGKSSFLRAGILPRLARDDRHFLPLPVIRPERAVLTGSNGLVECLWTVRRERKLNWSRRQVEDAVVAGAPALQPLLQELAQHCQVPDLDGANPQPPSLVLAIDQAEELFQAEGAEQAGRFLSLLAELLQADAPKLIVLCTIRSDSYEPLQSAPALVDITQRVFSLPPMPHGAFRQVIEAPVALLKHSTRPLRIEPQLTEALLRDIDEGGAKDALPLLAFTLERLYVDYSADGLLSLKDYEDLGRIAGAIEKAVAAALDQAQRNPKLPNDRDECLKLLRRGLIPWMAGIDRHSNLPYRKVALLSQVPEEARALIEHFVEHRLLAKDKNPQGETTIEPAHEALLRQWTKLRGWLEEDTVALATLESVKAASRDWDANERNPGWLTHSAGRLEDAEALNQRVDLIANLDQVDRVYLAECRKLEDEKRVRELLQARELAEAQQQRAEQQQRAVQRTRAGLVVASGLLVLAVVAAMHAWRAQEQAVEETARAELGLKQAAERALGRAREQLEAGDVSAYAAYLAESLGYRQKVGQNEAALALQQMPSPRLRQVFSLSATVSRAVFSPDGTRSVTVSENNALLWDVQSGATVGTPMNHEDKIRSVQFSHDGRRLVTASWDSTARLWDAHTGAGVGAPMRHEEAVVSAAFSPDGSRVVTASWDRTARLWDAQTGLAVGAPMRNEESVYSVDSPGFSPDGLRVVTVSGDGTARLWDAQTGEALGVLIRHQRALQYAQFSPDGLRVVTVETRPSDPWTKEFGIARLWDGENGGELGEQMAHDKPISAVAFSPDGTLVLTASSDDTARLWDAQSGAIRATMRHKAAVRFAAFSPDSKRVVTASADHTAQLWDARSGAALGAPMWHDDEVTHATFSPDGTLVLTGSHDHIARAWEANSKAALGAPVRHASPVQFAAVDSTGSLLVTASQDHTAQLWSVQTGLALGAPMRHEDWVGYAIFSPDGSRVLTASGDRTARLWDAKSGIAVGAPMPHEGSVRSPTFSPDGMQVATAGGNAAQLWDAASGDALGAQMRHERPVLSVNFSLDGLRLVTASFDSSARVWDSKTGAALGVPISHSSRVYSAAFSPDGTRLVTANGDSPPRGEALIWDPQNSTQIGASMRHQATVVSAAFSPDGTRIVTASEDQTARLWDGQTGVAIGFPMLHPGTVRAAKFSPTGTRVLTLSGDRVYLWDSQTGVAIGAPMKHQGSVFSSVFSPDETVVVTASYDGTARLWNAFAPSALDAQIESGDLVALSGLQVLDNGQLKWLTGPKWKSLINKVRAEAEQGTTKKDQLVRWHFADPATRTISPFSQIIVPQHIEREIAWVLEHPQTEKLDGPNYSPKILDDAYNLDPGHPLILLALSVFEDRPETKALWKRLSFPRFEKDPRLAARAAEILLIDKDPQNARKAAEIALALPSATDEDKARASAVLTKINAPNNDDAR